MKLGCLIQVTSGPASRHLTIGAYIPIGAGDTRIHPRGVPFRSYEEMSRGIHDLLLRRGYTKAVVWMPVGREPPYADKGTGGGLCFDGINSIREPNCQWMGDTKGFVTCWSNAWNPTITEKWLYPGNLSQVRPGFIPLSDVLWPGFVARAKTIVQLAKDAGFTGICIDASGDSGAYTREYELAKMIRDAGLRVGHEGWAKDTAPHWKDEKSHHGFSRPQWWPSRAIYGRKPVGGRSILYLPGTKEERLRLAREILAEGDGVYDDAWNGLAPADLETN